MLIHDKFIYLHVPKTGGTFITEVLKSELSVSDGPGHAHSGWDDLPADMRDKPIIAFLRNPWDWYVSYYHFLAKTPGDQTNNKELQRRFLVEGYPDNFATAVRNACTRMSDTDDPLVEELIAELPDDPGVGIGLMMNGCDIYTSGFLTITGKYAGSNHVTVGRFENFADDLQQFLASAGVADADRVGDRLRTDQPTNATERHHYREYYDDELRDLVGNSCRMIIDQFGYRF